MNVVNADRSNNVEIVPEKWPGYSIEKKSRFLPPLSSLLERIAKHSGRGEYAENLKRGIHRKFKYLLDECLCNDSIASMCDDEGKPSMDKAFVILGKAYIRLNVIDEINKSINEALNSIYVTHWSKELWDLRQVCIEQKRLAEELVRSIYYHKEKENEKSIPEVSVPG